MGKFFNYESPFWQTMTKISDVLILNALVIVFSLPIVTLGAAVTALDDAMWKLIREEGTVWHNFWTAFKSNFKQSTIIWLITGIIGVVVGVSAMYYLSASQGGQTVFLVLACIPIVIWGGFVSWVFPLQSRFYNTVRQTMKNALLCCVGYLPQTLGMLILNLLPAALFLFRLDLFVQYGIFLFVGYFGLAAYLDCKMLRKPIEKLIGSVREANGELPEEEETSEAIEE